MVDVISACTSEERRQAATENGPGLTETAVEFVKKQSTFVHKVCKSDFRVKLAREMLP